MPARVALVSGQRDLAIRDTHMSSIAEIWPGADIVGPIDAGHLAHEERPEEMAALIGKLIGDRSVS